MELFIKFSFWLYWFSVMLKILCMLIVPYPRQISMKAEIGNLIFLLPFVVWVSVLFFNL